MKTPFKWSSSRITGRMKTDNGGATMGAMAPRCPMASPADKAQALRGATPGLQRAEPDPGLLRHRKPLSPVEIEREFASMRRCSLRPLVSASSGVGRHGALVSPEKGGRHRSFSGKCPPILGLVVR